jgi:hypothetical protein
MNYYTFYYNQTALTVNTTAAFYTLGVGYPTIAMSTPYFYVLFGGS